MEVQSEEWRDELSSWLDGFEWLWFCTLTFRPGFKPLQARGRLLLWIAQLRRELGSEDFGCFSIREFGRTGQDLHYHAIVKGLKRWGVDERAEFTERWNKLAGDARIDTYDAALGGLEYMLKEADPNDPDAIEIETQRTE